MCRDISRSDEHGDLWPAWIGADLHFGRCELILALFALAVGLCVVSGQYARITWRVIQIESFGFNRNGSEAN